MSTESETKSAGVPAGATHVCTKCGQYWMLAWQMVGGESDPDCGCEDDLRSIAEAGPAPTTAAPAEQLSGKATRQSHPYQPAMTLSEIGRDEELPESWTKRPAEQPGKAADPRPAQPQAPAEPSKEQIEKVRTALSNLWAPRSVLAELAKRVAVLVAAEAAPLREERDKLAGDLARAQSECERLAGRAGELHREATNAEAKVADLDARIAKMRTELESAASALDDAAKALAAKWQHPGLCSGQDAEQLSKTGFWAGIGEVMAHTMRAARRTRRAAIGAPEGHPPAAPSEAPPPREQELLGKEGATADTVAEALDGYKHLIDSAEGLCGRPFVDHREYLDILRAASAPPRKAPQWRSPRCDYSLRTLLLVALDHVALESHLLRADMLEAIEVFAPAPSSPEEQLSGKEVTK